MVKLHALFILHHPCLSVIKFKQKNLDSLFSPWCPNTLEQTTYITTAVSQSVTHQMKHNHLSTLFSHITHFSPDLILTRFQSHIHQNRHHNPPTLNNYPNLDISSIIGCRVPRKLLIRHHINYLLTYQYLTVAAKIQHWFMSFFQFYWKKI